MRKLATLAFILGLGCTTEHNVKEQLKLASKTDLETKIDEYQEGLKQKAKAEQETDEEKRKITFAAAAGHFYTAMLQRNNTYEAMLQYADSLSQEGSTKAAVEWVEKALQLKPTDAAAHMLKGQIWARIGAYAFAIESYTKAIELNDGATARWQRHFAYMHLAIQGAGIELDPLEKALVDVKRYSELNPDSPDGHLALYVVHGIRWRALQDEKDLYGAYLAVKKALPLIKGGKKPEHFNELPMKELELEFQQLEQKYGKREY